MLDSQVSLKRFDNPDEIRTFDKGTFALLEIGGMTIGRATYQPGWRWSDDVGVALGELHCHVEHVGMVVSGCATAAMAMAGWLKCTQAMCLTYLPRPTTAGWWVTNPTSRCTF